MVGVCIDVGSLVAGEQGDGSQRAGGQRAAGAAPAQAAGASPAPPVSTPSTSSEPVEYDRLVDALGLEADEEQEVFVYECKHIRGETLERLMEDFISSGGNVAASDEADLVVISDVKSRIPLLKRIAERVDRRVPQVLVEARVVELTIDSDFEKDVSSFFEHLPAGNDVFVKKVLATLTSPGPARLESQGGLFTFRPYVSTNNKGHGNIVETFIRYLQSNGRAKILSAPNLILQRGVEGSIVTGEEIPIQQETVVSGSISTNTVFKTVGIKLKVRPIMIAGDRVRLSVAPEVSTVTGYTNSGNGVANPIVAVRNANTELEVMDEQIISIGGLLRSEERTDQRRVPVVGSIPVLGHLFRGSFQETIQSQLVIFLTIRVLDEARVGDVVIHRPDETPAPVQQEIERIDAEAERSPKARIMDDLRMLRRDGQW